MLHFSGLRLLPYPNPARENIAFRFENTEYHEDMLFQCLDMMGRIVFRKPLEKGTESITMDFRQSRVEFILCGIQQW